jgi:succinate dehydrogenase / fumarate reductase flavoprotein subunit
MRTAHRTVNVGVLVIGSGAAGTRAAIEAAQAGVDVVVVGKHLRKDAHTVLAAGGINAALGTVDPEDSWEQHFADTMLEGYHLSDPRVVEIMAREAPQAVQELAEWGVEFARLPNGGLDQRFFGAHKYRRTCYAGDYTGRAILYTLSGRAERLGIPFHEHQYVSRLLVEDGVCFGAMTFNMQSGERTVYLADAVVLAAGGHTRLWRRSSSRRDENTGDGMYLALQAGARLMDMELVQFHPTGMVSPEMMAGTLVTEAVRGEGGYLLNNQGERYMKRYDPERMELSTRDRVALANYTEIIEGRGGPNGGVFLDISHREKSFILQKLPRMYRQFMESQLLDISRQPMEVAPTAHYSMGGVMVDPETHSTSISGLYAAGEVTGGLHGANRLGGNSLAETVIFGRRAGTAAAQHSVQIEVQIRSKRAINQAHDDLNALIRNGSEMARPLQRALRDVMWSKCGVVRQEHTLRTAITEIDQLKTAARQVDVRPTSEGFQDLVMVLDLQSALVTAEATVRSAIERRESRGAHQRTDYPDLDPALLLNFITETADDGTMTISSQPVPAVSPDLVHWVDGSWRLEVQGRLLE